MLAAAARRQNAHRHAGMGGAVAGLLGSLPGVMGRRIECCAGHPPGAIFEPVVRAVQRYVPLLDR